MYINLPFDGTDGGNHHPHHYGDILDELYHAYLLVKRLENTDVSELQDALVDYKDDLNTQLTDVRGYLTSDLQDDINNLHALVDGINAAEIQATLATIGDKIADEIQARSDGDAGLASDISGISHDIDVETDDRTAADNALDTRINTEVALRTAQDTAINGRIDNESTMRADGDDALRREIAGEISTRANADTALGARIDALESGGGEALDYVPVPTTAETIFVPNQAVIYATPSSLPGYSINDLMFLDRTGWSGRVLTDADPCVKIPLQQDTPNNGDGIYGFYRYIGDNHVIYMDDSQVEHAVAFLPDTGIVPICVTDNAPLNAFVIDVNDLDYKPQYKAINGDLDRVVLGAELDEHKALDAPMYQNYLAMNNRLTALEERLDNKTLGTPINIETAAQGDGYTVANTLGGRIDFTGVNALVTTWALMVNGTVVLNGQLLGLLPSPGSYMVNDGDVVTCIGMSAITFTPYVS